MIRSCYIRLQCPAGASLPSGSRQVLQTAAAGTGYLLIVDEVVAVISPDLAVVQVQLLQRQETELVHEGVVQRQKRPA